MVDEDVVTLFYLLKTIFFFDIHRTKQPTTFHSRFVLIFVEGKIDLRKILKMTYVFFLVSYHKIVK